MDFNKHIIKVLGMFIEHKSVRIAYYAALGAVYLFALSALVNAVKWW